MLKASGHTHWTAFSTTDLPLSLKAARGKPVIFSVPPERQKTTSLPESPSSTSTSTNQRSGSVSSNEKPSPATSESGSFDQPDDEAGTRRNTDPSGTSTTVEIIPSSNMTGFVLFGVYGSKRLQSAGLRLAQINVAVYRDDDSFFDEMTVQYRKLRGFFRRIFSIWLFHTCEFIMV